MGTGKTSKPLSRFGRMRLSLIKRFIYSQLAIRTGFFIAIGKEQPLIKFKIDGDPPSVYWVFRIINSRIDDLLEELRLPSQFSLSPIRCLITDEPEYLMVVNVYHVSGLTNGVRSEWSVFVRDASNIPRYMIIDARSSQVSMDPIDIITKASTVVHERTGNQIQTRIGDAGKAFKSSIILPEPAKTIEPSPEWIRANDVIYWQNGVSDRTFYNAEMAFSRQISISKSNFEIKNDSKWNEFIETDPSYILMVDGALELIVSPWDNVDEIEI
jgi:hypothetical protein